MSTLASLRSGLRNRVHTIEVLLRTMATPVRNLAHEIVYTGYIKRINKMTFEANGNLLDIEAELWNNIEAPKLTAFKTSNTPVPLKSSPSQNQTTSYTEANQAKQAYRQKEAREKAKSRHIHIVLDYDTLK